MAETIVLMGLVFLAVQFCSPRALQGAGFPSAVDEISVRCLDLETPFDGQDMDRDPNIGIPTSLDIAICAPFWSDVLAGYEEAPGRRSGSSLIPVNGLQPAAP